MINFKINNGDLIAFLEKCACNGVVLVTSTEKTKRNFFNYFYMDVIEADDEENKGGIVVKAVDSEEKRMFIRHYLTDVEVDSAGKFAVTDVNLLLGVLKAIPSTRKIQFSQEKKGTILQIKTVDEGTFYGYDLRQAVPSEEEDISLTGSQHGVKEWDSLHSFENDIPKLTLGKESRLYDTVINFNKGELTKIVGISVALTKDQDLKFSVGKEKITIGSGKKKDNIQSKIDLKKTIENPIEITEKIITNLHPIVNHLFDTSTFFFRLASDGALKFWITSKGGNIELNFCSGSL